MSSNFTLIFSCKCYDDLFVFDDAEIRYFRLVQKSFKSNLNFEKSFQYMDWLIQKNDEHNHNQYDYHRNRQIVELDDEARKMLNSKNHLVFFEENSGYLINYFNCDRKVLAICDKATH